MKPGFLALCFLAVLETKALGSEYEPGAPRSFKFTQRFGDDISTPPGAPWTVQPKVAILDSDGNVVTSDNATIVELSIFRPVGEKLLGTTRVRVVNGYAIFTDLRMGKPTDGIMLLITSQPELPMTDLISYPPFAEN